MHGFHLRAESTINQQEIVDQHAFFVNVAAVRRGRSGGLAADIGMVSARGGEEDDVLTGLIKTGVMTVTSGRCVPPL